VAKYRKIKDPYSSRTYRNEKLELALFYCPTIYPCVKCGHPVVDGYCCMTCKTDDPKSADDSNIEDN